MILVIYRRKNGFYCKPLIYIVIFKIVSFLTFTKEDIYQAYVLI